MADIREQQLAVARALYDTTGKGDWAGAEALLTDDFYVTEASTLPYAGVYRGRAALRELFTRVMSSMSVTSLEVKALTQGDDHVVAILDLVLGASGSRVQIAEMFRFRGDRVCEIRPYYFDPSPVLAAVKTAKG